MKWRNLLLMALIGIFCFGGSFTCKSGDDDDDDHRPPPPPPPTATP